MKKPIVQADPNMDSLQYQIGFDAGADAMFNALMDQGGLQAWVDGAPEGIGLFVIEFKKGHSQIVPTRQLVILDTPLKSTIITAAIKRHMRINTDE